MKLAKTTVSGVSLVLNDAFQPSYSPVEERCEPSFPLFRNTGTRRFCPDIHDWKEFDNYEIGDGFGARDPAAVTEQSQHNAFDRYRRPTPSAPYRNNDDDAASDD